LNVKANEIGAGKTIDSSRCTTDSKNFASARNVPEDRTRRQPASLTIRGSSAK